MVSASNEQLIYLLLPYTNLLYDESFNAIGLPQDQHGSCECSEDAMKVLLSRKLGISDVHLLTALMFEKECIGYAPKLIVSAYDNLTHDQICAQSSFFCALLQHLQVEDSDGNHDDEIIEILEQLCIWRHKANGDVDEILEFLEQFLHPDYDNALYALECMGRVVHYGSKEHQESLQLRINNGGFFNMSAWDEWFSKFGDDSVQKHKNWLEEAFNKFKAALLSSLVKIKFRRARMKLRVCLIFRDLWIKTIKKRYAPGGSGFEEAHLDFVKRRKLS